MTAHSMARLSIPDLETGMSFLNRLALANPATAELQLLQFLDTLLDEPPDAADLFALLEQARVPLCFVEEEMVLRYHNKALPLPEIEEACFQRVVEVWTKMRRAYSVCAELQQPDTQDPAYAERIATILHRCIYYSGMVIVEHFRARRELPAGAWLELHGFYATAEEWRVATTPIADNLDHDQQTTHCAAAYVTLLLVDIASPYSLSVRDLNLIRRWATMWSPLVGVSPVADDIELPPFVVELMRDTGMHPTPYAEEPSADVRRLDTTRLAAQVNQTLAQLKQRIPPTQLNLGEETNTHVTRLMTQLSRPWAQMTAPRRFRRFPTTGQARVAIGFEPMHYFVSDKEFEQPDTASTYSRGEFDSLFMFRQMADPSQKPNEPTVPDYSVDVWEVVNHSANGFRLARSAVGQRMAHGQLIALCPHDGEQFILAQTSWLMQDSAGGLLAGVAILPGKPLGVAIRLSNRARAGTDRFSRAFLLSPVAAIGEEGSLVLPLGMYQASQLLDLADGGIKQAKMKNILQRGVDFERISFELV